MTDQTFDLTTLLLLDEFDFLNRRLSFWLRLLVDRVWGKGEKEWKVMMSFRTNLRIHSSTLLSPEILDEESFEIHAKSIRTDDI